VAGEGSGSRPPPKALLAWSSGKDSAWALHLVRQSGEVEVAALLTTFTAQYGRVTMHGVREGLVAAQAAALGLPLRRMYIPTPCSNPEYEARLGAALSAAKAEGASHVVFGDLYLADVREFREKGLAAIGMTPVFPLWHRGTALTAEAMVLGGLRARVVCVDLKRLPREFCGREYDADFVCDLPASVDPCGENGEFHTFCYGGPMFAAPLAVRNGETIERDGFAWTELLLAGDD
jgi:uncharacterized protein (TIGR00290 family)